PTFQMAGQYLVRSVGILVAGGPLPTGRLSRRALDARPVVPGAGLGDLRRFLRHIGPVLLAYASHYAASDDSYTRRALRAHDLSVAVPLSLLALGQFFDGFQSD